MSASKLPPGRAKPPSKTPAPAPPSLNEFSIRAATSQDSHEIWEIRTHPKVLSYLYAIPSLRPERQEFSHLDHVLVAIENETDAVVGMVGLYLHPMARARHRAELGIMVHPDYQGFGLGRRLMDAALDLADNYLRLVRIELEVMTDNHRAIHLYETLGFQTEALRRAVVIRDGEYADAVTMARLRYLD